MSFANYRNSMEWALLVAFVFGVGAIAQAQDNEDKASEGRIVQISPSNDNTVTADQAQEGAVEVAPQPEPPKRWIGLLGGPVTPELRAHIDIPEGQGLLVRQVVPNSPASEAGLKNYDILLRANETDLHEMIDLVDLVKAAGDENTQITLEVLRHGKHETVSITPTERPETISDVPAPGMAGEGQAFGEDGAGAGVPADVLKFFEQRGGAGGPFSFRTFGPGAVIHHGGHGLGGMPNGDSVSIQKQSDGSVHITVQRGDETWKVTGEDLGSLEQLPEDVRPFVEQLLHGGGGMQMPMPDMQQFNMPLPPPGEFNDRELGIMDRLEAMERNLRKLEDRLQNSDEEAPAATE